MENVNKKGKLRGKKFVWFERMLRREGRKLCAVALCASMIIGNMAWPAAAANDTSGEYSFELSSESLFDAIQDAIAEGTVVDSELDLKGSAADEYQSFLEAGSSLYEIEPVIDNEDSDRDKVLDLRAFVRLENDIELDSAYVMDGSEEITFLLVNSSDVYQQATISVDGRESETITVLPASAVAVDEEEAGPGVSGAANNSNTTVTGSGSGSGGSGGGGGSNTTTGAADSTQIDESAADDNNTADIVIENGEINNNEDEQDSVVEVRPEEGSDEEEQEPEKEDESAENQQDDADTDGADEDVSGTQDKMGDVSTEDDKDSDPDGTSDLAADENTDGNTTDSGSENDPDTTNDPEGSDVTDDSGSDPADEDDENGTDESDNDNTADDQDDESDEETDDEDEEAGSGETVASAVSVHTTYLLAASATPSDAEEATPSDASGLNGEAYETILLDSEAVVAYVTTAEELELDKIETILYTAELDDVVFSVEVPVGALPWGVELKASEYEKDSETYQSRYAETVDMIDELDEEEDHTEAIRLFNVGFYDTDGVEVEPTEKVNVTITYLDAEADDVGQVVHFGEEGTEVIDVETDYDEDGNKNIAYEMESFSDIAAVASSDDGISVAAISGDTTVAVSDSITLTGSTGSNHSWSYTSSDGGEVALSNTYNSTVTVTGVTEGTVIITHRYRSGFSYTSETYSVTVTDSDATIRIYLYVQITFATGVDTSGWNVNNHGWYTIGYVDVPVSQLDLSNPTSSSGEYIYNESNLEVLTEYLLENGFVAYEGNSFDIDDILTEAVWTAFKLCNGADNYVAAGTSAYHLDGTLTIYNSHTLYYDDNVDNDSVSNMPNTQVSSSLDKDYDFTVSSTVPVREGYTFVGWNTEPDGSSVWYEGGGTISVATEETLYAIWTPVTTSVTVTKVWEDSENTNRLRPESVTVNLLKNGDIYTGDNASVTLNEDSNWTYIWTGLDQSENGVNIVWTVEEVAVDNYTSIIIGSADEGYVITNTLKTMDITVTKIVTGNMGDTTKEFTITVAGTEFNLAHNQSGIICSLPVGSTIILTENDYSGDGYEKPIVEYNGTEVTENDDGSYSITLVSGATEITVTNNKTKDVDAGVFLDSIPYVLLLSLAVIPSAFLLFRRRSQWF